MEEEYIGCGVIYARYSSHSQTEQSIEGQLEVDYAFAKRKKIKVIGEYIDRAISGKYDDRPDFLRMIEDAKTRNFQYIIVYKLDRFARNRYDSAFYKHLLKKYGVKVISATEEISDAPEGIILEAILEATAEYYSLELAQKVKRGHKINAEKGKFNGGRILYGYRKDKDGDCIVIDEQQAEVMRFVKDAILSGKSKKQIIDELNRRGLKNDRGKPVTITFLQQKLRNPKYIGKTFYNGILSENIYPALFTEEEFMKMQDILDRNKHAPARLKSKVRYLLQGKLYCGPCGAAMVGDSATSRSGETYYYYSCAQKKKSPGSCKKRRERKDFIEWYVVEQTVEYVLQPERMQYIAERIVAEYEKEFNGDNVKEMENKIAKIERETQKLVDAFIEADTPTARKSIDSKIAALEVEKSDYEIDLRKLRVAAGVPMTVEAIIAWLKMFTKGDPMEMEFRERIIDVLVNAVYLYDDQVVIYYNVKDGKQVSYIDMLEDVDENGEKIPEDDETASGDAGSGVRIIKDLVEQTLTNPNTPVRYIIKPHLFGIIIRR